MNRTIVIAVVLCAFSIPVAAEDLGNLSANPFLYESTGNPFGAGSLFAPNGSTLELVGAILPDRVTESPKYGDFMKGNRYSFANLSPSVYRLSYPYRKLE